VPLFAIILKSTQYIVSGSPSCLIIIILPKGFVKDKNYQKKIFFFVNFTSKNIYDRKYEGFQIPGNQILIF